MPSENTSPSRRQPRGLKLLYEDRDILVVDKPSGLLTMGTERDKTRTAYYLVTDYVRKGNPRSKNRVFIVHRLDRDTSGVLLLAKDDKSKTTLQEGWDKTQKKYLAVVHGRLSRKEGTISTYLAENSAHKVYSTNDPRKGKLSHTAYRVLKETRDFSLVEIDLLTGRKNQIRVHFAELGHPVAGDRKYGEGRTVPHLALHARSIAFSHPYNGRQMVFIADVPDHFTRLIGRVVEGRNASSDYSDTPPS